MKLLTVSLLICVLIALAQAAALHRLRRTWQRHTGEDQLPERTTIPTTLPPFPGGDHGPYYPGGDYGPHGPDYGPHGPDHGPEFFPLTPCKPGWKKESALCLLYVPDSRTWSDAKDFCVKEDGHLVAALKGQFSEEISDVIKGGAPQIWVGSCTTIGGYMGSSTSTPAYIKNTPGGWECVEAKSSEKELPFICSILRI